MLSTATILPGVFQRDLILFIFSSAFLQCALVCFLAVVDYMCIISFLLTLVYDELKTKYETNPKTLTLAYDIPLPGCQYCENVKWLWGKAFKSKDTILWKKYRECL